MSWYVKCLKNYVKFWGRARRKEFWMFQLIHFLIICALVSFEQLVTETEIVYPLYGLVMIIPYLAVSVRRLHDIGFSGWWYLLNIIPLVSIVLWILFCIKGQDHPNKYGPDPKEPIYSELSA